MKVIEQLEAIKTNAKERIQIVKSIHELNEVKSQFLGKKGSFSEVMSLMKDLPNSEKPAFGKLTNEAKVLINNYIDEQKKIIEDSIINEKLSKEKIDVTLPGKSFSIGANHLLTEITEEIEDLFIGMGYQVMEGPEIEIDEINFEKLNLPKNHPARDMQDTFYITDELLLRTHTSPVQVRTMLDNKEKGPIQIICPGKVFRRDDDDATHSHQFIQIEGLVIDEKTSMSDLKGTLLEVARKMFGDKREIRLRPSYFPFTEPSVEVDVTCANCNGRGCNICKQTGWIEILGAGMVNNSVLEASGYDSTKYQGFAFGMGVERIAMLKYGINDIRMFYLNDLRFNKQFKK